MSEKRGRGRPKFEPTPEQRYQVKLMKAVGIPEDRICKTITNPQTTKPVAPATLARAFAAELESGATEVHAHVGNFIICAILGKKPALGDAIKSEQFVCGAKLRPKWRAPLGLIQALSDAAASIERLPVIIAPRAQASRRCETQAPLSGKPLSFATVSVP